MTERPSVDPPERCAYVAAEAADYIDHPFVRSERPPVDEGLREARKHAHNVIDFGVPPKAPFLVVHTEDRDTTEAIRDAVFDALASPAAPPEGLDAAEHDAGKCPSCLMRECIGRLDYEDCTHPGAAQAVAENVARLSDTGETS